jgi:thioredoxin reductase (NADPH)
VLRARDDETGEEEDIAADGAFIIIGLKPNTSFLSGTIDLDENGFVDVIPGSVETSESGIFAVGDCRKGAIAQVAAATGEGVAANFATIEYLRMRCGPPADRPRRASDLSA